MKLPILVSLLASMMLGHASSLEEATILTPKPLRTPRINGAKIFGVRPGSPFLFTIPATGDRPMTFAADTVGAPRATSVDRSKAFLLRSSAMASMSMRKTTCSSAVPARGTILTTCCWAISATGKAAQPQPRSHPRNNTQIVRDLWRQKDLGGFDKAFNAVVPRHGVVLVRLRAVQTP